MSVERAPKKRRLWRRILFWTVISFTALPITLALTLFFYAERLDPERFRNLLLDRVNRSISGQIEIGRIDASLTGKLELLGFRLLAPPPFQHTVVLSVPRLEISLWPFDLLQKTVSLKKILFAEPELVIEKLPDGRIGLSEALKSRNSTVTVAPAAQATSPAETTPLLQSRDGRTALKLPELPVWISLGVMEISGFRFSYYDPATELAVGPVDFEASGDLGRGKGRLFQKLSFQSGPESRQTDVRLRTGTIEIKTALDGKIMVRADSSALEHTTIIASVKTQGLGYSKNSRPIPVGETALDIRNATEPGEFTISLSQGAIFTAGFTATLPIAPPHRSTGLTGSAGLDLDELAKVLKAMDIDLPATNHARFDVSDLSATLTTGETFKADFTRIMMRLSADRIEPGTTRLTGASAELSGRHFSWTSGGAKQPVGSCASAATEPPVKFIVNIGQIRQPKLLLGDFAFAADISCQDADYTGHITSDIADVVVKADDNSDPLFRTQLKFGTDAMLKLLAGTVELQHLSFDLPDNRVTVPDRFQLDAPLMVRGHASANYREHTAKLDLSQLDVSDWFRSTLKSEVTYGEDKRINTELGSHLDLTRFGRAVEPLQDSTFRLDSIEGTFGLTSRIKGVYQPLDLDFQLIPEIAASLPGKDLPYAVGGARANGDISGHLEAKGQLSRLVGRLDAEAKDIRFRQNSIGRIQAKALFVPQNESGTIRAALEIGAFGTVLDAMGSDPLPDVSLWLKFLADNRRKRVTEISMPFSLKDVLNGRLEGGVDYVSAPLLDLRLIIEPFTFANLVKRLPENIKRSFARYKLTGTGSADLKAMGPVPGPDMGVTGQFPVRLTGRIDTRKVGADLGGTAVKGMTTSLIFGHDAGQQQIALESHVDEAAVKGLAKPLEDSSLRLQTSFENLNQVAIDEFRISQPVLGFVFSSQGSAGQLLTSPRADLRGQFSLDVSKAAPAASATVSGDGSLQGNLSVNIPSLKEAQFQGELVFKDVNARSGKNLQLAGANGPVGISAIATLANGAMALSPLRRDGITPETESLLSRRMKSVGEEGSPFRVKEIAWGSAKISDFSSWVSVEGDTLKCRSMEAGVLDGSLVGDFESRFYPSSTIWFEGSMTRVNAELLATGSAKSALDLIKRPDFRINQNLNVRLNSKGDIDARINVTRIGKEAMDGLLDLIDPEHQNPQINKVRKQLEIGFIPRFVVMDAENGFMNMFISLTTRVVSSNYVVSILVKLLGKNLGGAIFGLDHHINRIPLEQILKNARTRGAGQ